MIQSVSILKISIVVVIFASNHLAQAGEGQDLQAKSGQDNDTQANPSATRSIGPLTKSSRGGRMLDLDRLAGEVAKDHAGATGGRQSRMLGQISSSSTTDDQRVEERARRGGTPAKRMAIKGFIPIVSLDNSKDGKQLEGLADQFSDAPDQDDSQNGDGDDEPEQQPSQASPLREHLASSFGAQTSIGHASFAAPSQQQQQFLSGGGADGSQWQQLQPAAAEQQLETGRARKLLGGSLLAGHRHGLRPTSGLVANLVAHPASFEQGHHHLAGPMNVPVAQAAPSYPPTMPAPQPQQFVALGLEQAQEQCLCVPFFQCKNGFLSESQLSKGQLSRFWPQSSVLGGASGQVPRSLSQPAQTQGQSISSQPSDQQMVNDIYEQLRKNIESQNLERELLQQQQQLMQPLLDERNARGASNSSSSAEGEERSLLNTFATGVSRRQSSAGRHCGIMRTCCRVPPHLVGQAHWAKQQQAARFVQRQQPNYQLLTPSRLQAPLADQMGPDYSMLGAQLQQPAPSQFAEAIDQSALAPVSAASVPRPSAGQFMSGRCGLRQSLGISGRVQNSQAQAQGEQTNAEFGEFPAHAAILRRMPAGESLFVCSAVLVSNQWLATAAHCVKKLRADELKARLGEWDVSRDDEFYPHVESNVREILLHPQFQPSSLANDLALIRLDQTLGTGDQMPHIAPACLAQPDEQFAGQRCWLAGWGKDAFGQTGAFQSTLRKVDLPVVAHDQCESALRFHTKLGKFFRLHPNSICAGGERGKDACEGDGGAGLYCLDPASGLSKAVALVSWGVGCGQRGVPGVYVNLAAFAPWIEQVVASSGEENVYTYTNLLGGRQQPGPGADPFRSIISERSSSNVTAPIAAAESPRSAGTQLDLVANKTEAVPQGEA